MKIQKPVTPAAPVQQKASGPQPALPDLRAQTAFQLRIQAAAENSPQVAQLRAVQSRVEAAVQRKANRTGMPDNLKSGIERLSGMRMDDVKVHYNSSKPAQLQAHAYAQGNQIHLAPGQQKHLPHEAWHVVQQKQGRVKPTMQMKGAKINDNPGLEREADRMGSEALKS